MKTFKEHITKYLPFTPPPVDEDAPAELKKILKDVYSSCRYDWHDKHPKAELDNNENQEYCAKVAWSAVKKAGFHKNSEGKWIK